LIREDAIQSMPPYDMWLAGGDDIFAWWLGPRIGCRGSRILPTSGANGMPAFGQFKPSPDGGYAPRALHVLELSGGRIAEFTFFVDTARLFPLFGLPVRLDGRTAASAQKAIRSTRRWLRWRGLARRLGAQPAAETGELVDVPELGAHHGGTVDDDRGPAHQK